jgi:glycosyltransferase involved in cell wall biosynthesis
LRILFLVYRDFSNPLAVGGDLYFWELAKGLASLGNYVTLICSQYRGSKLLEMMDGVNIVRIGGKWRLPLEVLKRYLGKDKGKFDVVIEEVIGGERLPFLFSLYAKEPLVAVWHQKNTAVFREQCPFLLSSLLSLIEFIIARCYRNRIVVAPSEGAREKILTLGFKPENVKVVYDGVGKRFQQLKPSCNRKNRIVCLGKIRKYKRFDHALMAFRRVLELSKRPCRLVIAGKVSEIDRGYLNWLRKLSINLGISKHVEFRLNISEDEKIELLSESRLLVQPSPVEGFSIVVAEANCCGTPVVVSDGVPADVVVNNFNGLVYHFGDINEMAEKTCYLLGNDVEWRRMSLNSKRWSKKFTWEKSVSNLEKILIGLADDS